MPNLPIYSRNSQISPNQVVRRTSSGLAESASQFGKASQDLAVKWQETQNAAENLDGKNKLEAQIQDIMMEADQYNDYNSTKDIEAKQSELMSKIDRVVPDIVGGFGTDSNASSFARDAEKYVLNARANLQGLMRKKQIDNTEANLLISADRNLKGFVSSGNPAFKQSYLNDLAVAHKNGFIDKAALTAAKLKTDDWDFEYAESLASNNPDAAKKYAETLPTGRKKSNLLNYIKAEKNRAIEEHNQEILDNFMVNPTQEGYDAISKSFTKLSKEKKQAIEDAYLGSKDYMEQTNFKGSESAKKALNEILALPDDTNVNAMDKMTKMADFFTSLNKHTSVTDKDGHVIKDGNISLKDRDAIAQIAYRTLNDTMFKDQVHAIFGTPGAFTSFVNWGLGSSEFDKVEALGTQALQSTLDYLMAGDVEGASKNYAEYQQKAIQIRYPEIPFNNMKKGDIFYYGPTSKAYKFLGYGMGDVLVEVDPKNGDVK